MENRPQVLIVGAGFGGLWAALRLKHAPVDVLVLDRHNYHTFFPLLYQVAAAELEPEEIVYPVRSILRRYAHLRFLMTDVQGVDLERRIVRTTEQEYHYDYLILAAGSSSYFYGVQGAEEQSFQLKSLEQASRLRNHILSCFERALNEPDPSVRQRLLSFVIVGGGPTGVEFAGALAELVRGPLRKDYPSLDFKEVQVRLVEASHNLLNGFSERLQSYALKRLGGMGVLVQLDALVSQLTPGTADLKNGTLIPTETVVWTAGVKGETLRYDPAPELKRSEQIKVEESLQIPGHPEVYAIGDLAYFEQDERPLPMVAPAATQQGEAAADNILRQLKGQETLSFRYRDPGMMVTLGRNAAIVSLGKSDFTGFVAWVMWLGLHLYKLIGFRNRLQVLINWAWDYLLYEKAVRLILPE